MVIFPHMTDWEHKCNWYRYWRTSIGWSWPVAGSLGQVGLSVATIEHGSVSLPCAS